MSSTNIISLNVRGLRNQDDRKKLFKFLKNTDGDIFLLQETHSTEDDRELWDLQWGGQTYFANGNNFSRGTAILFRTKDTATVSSVDKDPKGCYILMDVIHKDLEFTLASIYAPNCDDPDFFKKLDDSHYAEKVIGGDFNVVLDPIMDRENCKENHEKAMHLLNNNT